MKERLCTYLRHPRLILLRRLVMLWLVFVLLGCLACHAMVWEVDFYGYVPVYEPLRWVACMGGLVVPVLILAVIVWWGVRFYVERRREKKAAAEVVAEEVQMELPLVYPVAKPGYMRRWWDVWLLLFALGVCVPLCWWFDYLESSKSTLRVSCQGNHGDSVFARAAWDSPGALAEGVQERLPAEAPYLHSFRLPDGDFRVTCQTGATSFALSHIRRTRRFTLRPHFDISGEIDLYICPILNEPDRKRVRTLLNYYMENPQARRPRIKRMSFSRCEDAAVLYLDYGEYVLLPVPKGTEPSDAPALIYLSLLP